MKRFFALILLFAVWVCCAFAQNIPSEWKQYTTSRYLYNVQHDYKYNYTGTETGFKDYLKSMAQGKLGEMVKVQVTTESARLAQSVNGQTNMVYVSRFNSISDVELKLVETRTKYDERTQECWAIAYIDKEDALHFYDNQIEQVIGQATKAKEIAKKMEDAGNYASAEKEVKDVLPMFEQLPDYFFWLNFYGISKEKFTDKMNRCASREKDLKLLLADKHKNKIYVTCTADLFGSPYYALEGELKGALSRDGCDLVSDPEQATWVINVSVTTREYNMNVIGSVTSYFSYADAQVTIDKQSKSKGSQRVFADQVSVKGGHTFNYTEAGRAAYKDLSKELSKVITPKVRE